MNTNETILFLNNIFQIPSSYQIPMQLSIDSKNILLNLALKINKIRCVKPTITFLKGMKNIKTSVFYESIPIMIRQDINTKSYNQCKYELLLPSNRKINIYIITENQDKTNYISLYNKISLWLHFIDTITLSTEYCKLLNIYLILNNCEKKLPIIRSTLLDPININSGFTFNCKEKNDIFIYRKEEVLKLLIHESFHSFNLDFSNMDQEYANYVIKKTFHGLKNVTNDLRIYETYTEIWAEIITILIINKNNIYLSFNKINECFFYERLWSLYQCGKILHHYNMKMENLIHGSISTSTSTSTSALGYEKNTTPFSYFILKAICFENLNDFLFLCNKMNKNVINFTNEIKNIITFCNFLTKRKNLKHFIYKLDDINEWFLKGKIKSNHIYLLKTLRMSMYG